MSDNALTRDALTSSAITHEMVPVLWFRKVVKAPNPTNGHDLDAQKLNHYSELIFLLYSDPQRFARLFHILDRFEVDAFLHNVMFVIYRNQYDSRDEHLLLTMFQSVLAAQFESATEFSLLLCPDLAVSRLMSTYNRRDPGQYYLKNVLAERVRNLIDHKDLNLEIDPEMVNMMMRIERAEGPISAHLTPNVPLEVIVENPDVQAIIAPRSAILMEIANGFLSDIIDSIERVPYGIRWICKQIRSLTRKKYPEATDRAVCSLIGGFFFLRLINPAIVSPVTFSLVDECPSKYPKRTLLKVAVMLQALVNRSSHTKQPHFTVLRPFVENNEARINQFLNDLCEVDDFPDPVKMVKPTDPPEWTFADDLYFIHAFILRHVDSLAQNDRRQFRSLFDKLGPPVVREDNCLIDLNLHNR